MTETQTKHFSWDEGKPTKPEVDALLAAWPAETIRPNEWSVSDEEVGGVIGRCNSARFRTVTDAWKKRLQRDYQVTVWRLKSRGFYCPTASDVLGRTHPVMESAGRKFGKQLRDLANAKPASNVESDAKDHHGRLLSNLRRETRKARLNVLPSTQAQQAPQIAAPKR